MQEKGLFSAGVVCAYFGVSPSYAEGLPESVRVTCANKALGTARAWYERREFRHHGQPVVLKAEAEF